MGWEWDETAVPLARWREEAWRRFHRDGQDPVVEVGGSRRLSFDFGKPKTIMVRDEYLAIWEHLEARWRSRPCKEEGGLILWGQPGVGEPFL